MDRLNESAAVSLTSQNKPKFRKIKHNSPINHTSHTELQVLVGKID